MSILYDAAALHLSTRKTSQSLLEVINDILVGVDEIGEVVLIISFGRFPNGVLKILGLNQCLLHLHGRLYDVLRYTLYQFLDIFHIIISPWLSMHMPQHLQVHGGDR